MDIAMIIWTDFDSTITCKGFFPSYLAPVCHINGKINCSSVTIINKDCSDKPFKAYIMAGIDQYQLQNILYSVCWLKSFFIPNIVRQLIAEACFRFLRRNEFASLSLHPCLHLSLPVVIVDNGYSPIYVQKILQFKKAQTHLAGHSNCQKKALAP